MLGIVLVLIWGAAKHFGASDVPLNTLFLQGTDFLYTWYIVFTVILGVINLGYAICLPIVYAGYARDINPNRWRIYGLLGALAGGGLSVILLAVFAVGRACLIGGTYLLHQSLMPDGAWDQTKLIWGGIVLLIGLVLSMPSPSSSSNKQH